MGQLKGQGDMADRRQGARGPLPSLAPAGSDCTPLKRQKKLQAGVRGQVVLGKAWGQGDIAGLVPEALGRAKCKRIASLLANPGLAAAEEPLRDPVPGDLHCNICSGSDGEEGLLVCDGCEGGFHLWCLRPILVTVPQGSWLCPHCRQPEQREEFPLVQTLIHSFFKVQHRRRRLVGSTAIKSAISDVEQAQGRGGSGVGSGAGLKVQVPRLTPRACQGDEACCADPASAVLPVPSPFGCWRKAKRRRKQSLVPHRPSLCATQRLRQMQSLATALTAVGAEFSDDLVYRLGAHGVTKRMNDPHLEVQEVQDLPPDDLVVFEWCKEMTRQGWGTPLVVKWDANQGYVVEADGPIPDWSLIAEYAGDVDTLARQLKLPSRQAGDAMMTLLNTGHPRTDLVICPEAHANAVRFVSGINSSCRESRKRINCRCVRFNIGGEVRALLIAIRHIATGERLYYDYNGLEHDYPTHNFL